MWYSDLGELPWLLPAPADYRTRVLSLEAMERVDGATLRALASYALDLNNCHHLAKACQRLRDRIDAEPWLSPLRIAIVSGGTASYLGPAIVSACLRHGVLAEVYIPGYGQAETDVLDPESRLHAFRPEVAVVGFDHRVFGLKATQTGESTTADRVAAAVRHLSLLTERLLESGTQVVLQTLAEPPERWCGHFDPRVSGSVSAQISTLNQRIIELTLAHGASLLDVAGLAGLIGTSRWFDHAQWYNAKVPFALELVPFYSEHVARLMGALRGRSRKCLVLDLDNVLWGGVIGDDGLEGIELGHGSANGEAYVQIQAYALELKTRGILLAACSKNEEDTARMPFRDHPEMLLKEDDFSAFVANWDSKPSNLVHIARLLNIGTDALVLLDDNPVERDQMRQALPEVAVPELPEDPAWFPSAVAHAGYFEAVGLSPDDVNRAQYYRANAARAAAQEASSDIDTFHRSLEMVCDISSFDALSRGRIVQLIGRSNQFNLMTRRYTEAQVALMESDPSIFTLQARLTDRFGDNGMISVVIFRKGEKEWLCDTWLMSCRVVGRRVEEAVLAVVASAARAAGATRLIGDFMPSAKNRMVADFWNRLGFRYIGSIDSVGTRWALDLQDYAEPDLPMRISVSTRERPSPARSSGLADGNAREGVGQSAS
jgi:FkbH-like protein